MIKIYNTRFGTITSITNYDSTKKLVLNYSSSLWIWSSLLLQYWTCYIYLTHCAPSKNKPCMLPLARTCACLLCLIKKPSSTFHWNEEQKEKNCDMERELNCWAFFWYKKKNDMKSIIQSWVDLSSGQFSCHT